MGRIIGIVHRIKQTAKGEARPTIVAISGAGKVKTHNLETETDELDFLLARFPVEFRLADPADDLSKFKSHQIKWRQLKKTENPADFPINLLRQEGKDWFLALKVPIAFDGLKADDTVAMIMGGSGDRLAYAIARQGEKINASLIRVTPAKFKACRSGKDKDSDHLFLAILAKNQAGLFERINPRDLELIKVREAFNQRQEAMKARIACEQRLRQRMIGRIFMSDEGGYPEGSIEDIYDGEKANDAIFQSLSDEQAKRENELRKIVRRMDLWQKVFEPIEGCGEVLAARLISAIGDVRRFATDAKLKAFCGMHLLADGRFPRKRAGEVANWHNDARQALYLLGDQFNRRANSQWGKKLREIKVKFRVVHPEAIQVPVPDPDNKGKTKLVWRYNDGHIHKMGIWRTLTKFTEWLFREWNSVYTDSESVATDDKNEKAA